MLLEEDVAFEEKILCVQEAMLLWNCGICPVDAR
jgi:hypothetical protein